MDPPDTCGSSCSAAADCGNVNGGRSYGSNYGPEIPEGSIEIWSEAGPSVDESGLCESLKRKKFEAGPSA